MAGHWTTDYSFNTGAIRRRDFGYLAASADAHIKKRVARSVIMACSKGKFGPAELADRCVGVAVARHPIEQGVFVGEAGNVFAMGSNDQHAEVIGAGKSSPKIRGPLRCARAIEGKVYAAGMDRQVYVRQDRDEWIALDHGARRRKGDKAVIGFEGIDGFRADALYAVGWNGEIWRFGGKRWSRVGSPTDRVLTNVCCAGDGNVYACGRDGVLVRGRGGEDEDCRIIAPKTKEDLWGLAWYRDRLYVASLRAVYTLDGDALKVVDFGADVPATCHHLAAGDGKLWSIGPKDVMEFDGKKWCRID